MKTFLIVDTWNLCNRMKFSSHNNDVDLAVGFALHLVFMSINAMCKKYTPDHVLFMNEGYSWRKKFKTTYKANRDDLLSKNTPTEIERNELFNKAFKQFQEFIDLKTNCTVLRHSECEADDLIAGWIQSHPKDKHIIISGDTDFCQLLTENVILYDGVQGKTTTINGCYNDKNKPILDKKTKEHIKIDPEYYLFLKIVRGDKTDNVFPAFPGVRETKILDAYKDRHTQGYNWNNFMMSKWTDHNKVDHIVKETFLENKILIDLSSQPENIKACITETINNAYLNSKNIKNVGFNLLQYCGAWDLKTVAKVATDLVEYLNKTLVQDKN